MVHIASVVGRTPRVRLVFVVASVLIASVCHAQWVASTQYSSGFSVVEFADVQRITKGPDGALWFTTGCRVSPIGGSCTDRIGRITTSGVVTKFSLPRSTDAAGITTGPDGALWFTEWVGNRVGRITTDGAITEYPIPTAKSGAGEITAALDGALWFVEETANKIGRVTVTGNFTEYPLPGSVTAPTSITAGSDGALWFAYRGGIGRMTTAGSLSAVYTPGGSVVPDGVPAQIIAGPDGALWFTETSSGSPSRRGIGRLTTAGVMTEYAVPQPGSGGYTLYGIAAGPDGAVWFMDGTGPPWGFQRPPGYLGRITPSGTLTQYPVPPIGPQGATCCQDPGITAGPDGALWYVGADNILIRSPACGLGLGLSYKSPTLTMSFDLGIAIPGGGTGNWSSYLVSSRVIPLYSKTGLAVVPPKHFSIPLPLANVGLVGVLSTLSTTAGGLACADVQFTNTGGTGMTINQLRDVLRSSGIVPGLR